MHSFYAYWEGFSTRRSFAWCDKYNPNEVLSLSLPLSLSLSPSLFLSLSLSLSPSLPLSHSSPPNPSILVAALSLDHSVDHIAPAARSLHRCQGIEGVRQRRALLS